MYLNCTTTTVQKYENYLTNRYTILKNRTCLLNLGFKAVQNLPTVVTPGCTLVSPQIIDLSGNHSFYFTTNLNRKL